MGRVIAGTLHIPVRTDILARTKRTAPQVTMNHRKERLKNMDHVFSVRGTVPPSISMIVCDDVFTTGATIRSAVYALKQSGAGKVWAVTIAR